MSQTKYTDFNAGDYLQINVMHFILWWVRTKKTPIPRMEIINYLKENHINRGSAEAAIRELLYKRYIRKGVSMSGKAIYVMLRNL